MPRSLDLAITGTRGSDTTVASGDSVPGPPQPASTNLTGTEDFPGPLTGARNDLSGGTIDRTGCPSQGVIVRIAAVAGDPCAAATAGVVDLVELSDTFVARVLANCVLGSRDGLDGCSTLEGSDGRAVGEMLVAGMSVGVRWVDPGSPIAALVGPIASEGWEQPSIIAPADAAALDRAHGDCEALSRSIADTADVACPSVGRPATQALSASVIGGNASRTGFVRIELQDGPTTWDELWQLQLTWDQSTHLFAWVPIGVEGHPPT